MTMMGENPMDKEFSEVLMEKLEELGGAPRTDLTCGSCLFYRHGKCYREVEPALRHETLNEDALAGLPACKHHPDQNASTPLVNFLRGLAQALSESANVLLEGIREPMPPGVVMPAPEEMPEGGEATMAASDYFIGEPDEDHRVFHIHDARLAGTVRRVRVDYRQVTYGIEMDEGIPEAIAPLENGLHWSLSRFWMPIPKEDSDE